MPSDHSAFIKAFFLTSDNGTDHAGYVANFTDNATLKMGLKTAEGSAGRWISAGNVHTALTLGRHPHAERGDVGGSVGAAPCGVGRVCSR